MNGNEAKMSCSEVTELAPLYLSADLDRARSAAFEAHLKSCPECMREFERQARLDARLREAIVAEPLDTVNLDRRVRERIGAEAGKGARWPLYGVSGRPWALAAVAVVAAMLVAAAGYRVLLGSHVPRVYADAALDHKLEVTDHGPRQWLVDPTQIAALAETQGIAGSAPSGLAANGYRLERGKLCFLDGRIFLHLVYANGAAEFSVYLRQRGDEPLPGKVRETENGRTLHASSPGDEHIASFQTDSLTVVVVTNQPADAALGMARFAASAL
jgi:anti-sigma factor RsiW